MSMWDTIGMVRTDDRVVGQDEVTAWFSQFGVVVVRATFKDNVRLNGRCAAGFDIQTGLDTVQVVNIAVADLQAAALGVDALDFSTAAGASAGLATLDTAIDTVATERANLGAQQNRLTSAVDNLTSSVTNLSESKSRIEDADFSVESTNLAAAGILAQEIGRAHV